MAAEDALNQLIDAGLEAGERTDAFDGDVAAGAIVSTTPEAGTEVAPGTTIDYVVSSGPEPTATPEPTPELVTVPNLRGEDPDDAVNVLLDAGLQPGERQDRFNDNVPEGQVIRTDPAAGTEVVPGTTVDYRVSRGPEPTAEPTAEPTSETPVLVTIPDLRGIGVDDAVNSLIDLGLEPGRRIDRVNGAVPVGQVIRTVPEAGTEVEAGTSVNYYVSREADATAEPTQEPTAAPTDNGTGQGAQAAVDEVAGQVPAIRELEPRKEVPYREITQRQFRRMVAASFDEDNPASRVAAEETLLKRLGLLPEDADLRELMLDMYESQVAAFYDPDTGDMTVIQRDGDFGPEDRLFVAHEYDHALQDQYWDLNKVTDVSASQGDRALARLALIEGDATTAMLQWAAQNLSQEQLAEVGSSLTPADQDLLDSMPAILRRQLEFPYLDGQVFVSTLMGQGGWDVVNQAWDRLPASTEQILHPERYPDDAPIKLEMPDVAAALGEGWDQRYVQTLGELDISVLLRRFRRWRSCRRRLGRGPPAEPRRTRRLMGRRVADGMGQCNGCRRVQCGGRLDAGWTGRRSSRPARCQHRGRGRRTRAGPAGQQRRRPAAGRGGPGRRPVILRRREAVAIDRYQREAGREASLTSVLGSRYRAVRGYFAAPSVLCRRGPAGPPT